MKSYIECDQKQQKTYFVQCSIIVNFELSIVNCPLSTVHYQLFIKFNTSISQVIRNF